MLTELTRQSRTISRVEEIRNYCQEAPRYRQDILDYFQTQWSKSETTVAQAIQSALRQGDIEYTGGKYRTVTDLPTLID